VLNPWFAMLFQAARLGWEAQTVIALRWMRLADGDSAGHSESRRMDTEKRAALTEAHTAEATVAIKSGNAPAVAKKVATVAIKSGDTPAVAKKVASVAIKSGNAPAVAKKVMRVYKKRVGASKRRLSKSK
jgi:hypothetical protein